MLTISQFSVKFGRGMVAPKDSTIQLAETASRVPWKGSVRRSDYHERRQMPLQPKHLRWRKSVLVITPLNVFTNCFADLDLDRFLGNESDIRKRDRQLTLVERGEENEERNGHQHKVLSLS